MLDALSRRVSKIEVHDADPDINNLIQSMKTFTVSLHALRWHRHFRTSLRYRGRYQPEHRRNLVHCVSSKRIAGPPVALS